MDKTPTVSVLMSVYNTKDEYLKEAIESILVQSYTDFEFLIIDDKTCDSNLILLDSYNDPRIRIIHNDCNLGLTESLYNGVNLAQGKYIARMDSDDVSCPDRLKTQVKYLEKNPDVAVVGSAVKYMDTNKIVMHLINDDTTLKLRGVFTNCFVAHSSAMLNADILRNNNINYDKSIKKAQDYMLWADCVMSGLKIRTIEEILVLYRVHDGQITKNASQEQCGCAKMVQNKMIKKYFGYDMSAEETDIHFSMLKDKMIGNAKNYESHVHRILDGNEKNEMFKTKYLYRECYYIWILMTIKNIVRYKCFSGIFTKIFWKAIARVDFWHYYYENTIKCAVKERKILKKYAAKKES